MKLIKLTQGKTTQVSDHRFEYLNQFKWAAAKHGKTYYAVRFENNNGVKIIMSMHREIFGLVNPKILVDHADGNGLNNQDENLRVCNNSQNQMNRGKNNNGKSIYKGVYFNKRAKKWHSQIQINGVKKYLGLHENEHKAAMAYNDASEKYHPEFGRKNDIKKP